MQLKVINSFLAKTVLDDDVIGLTPLKAGRYPIKAIEDEQYWTDLIFSTTLEERIFDNLHLKGVLNMAKGQRLKPEQIVTLLRQIDVLTTNGKTLAQACKELGTVEQSYYRWRKMYGGMKVDQAKKYKELEQENTRLKKLVADLSLREVMLKEVIKGNF